MTRLVFEWDPNKAKSNLEKHGISFEEASSVFADFNSLTIDDPKHSIAEKRFITLGKSANGHRLVVVHTDRSSRIRIISARIASRKERNQYEKDN